MAATPPPPRSLRLLSLDGGGVRGLSSLVILRYLMKLINPQSPPKPCDYFDLICGTSTGGLIAIMLGRLRMDVDSCISVYQKLADKVFKPKRAKFNILRKGADLWQLSGSFDADVFAQAVKDLIAETGLPADAKLLERPAPNDIMAEDEQSQCRVFVCAVRTEINKAVRLRSYTTEASVEEVSCAIWEAARATSAASSFFSHIEIEGQRFTDGATECNNPIEHLIDEAEEIWPGSSKACVVSIGTGKPKLEAFGKNLVEVGKTLIRIATDAERTAENFQQSSRERGLQDVYYRFNVSHGLENVGLESSDQQGQIWAATNHYLNNYAVKQQCRALATSLRRIVSPIEHKRYLQTLRTYDVVQELAHTAVPYGATFQWVFQESEYRDWLRTSGRCLHVRGKPGCGKSVLMAYIKRESKYRTAFFACKETDHSRRTQQLVLSSLLHQILEAQPYLLQEALDIDHCDTNWTYEQLLASLRSVLCSRANEGVTCFIDGLDECDALSRKQLLKDLKKLFDPQAQTTAAPHARLVVSSRDYPDIHLRGGLIDLDNTPELNEDLHSFIVHEVTELTLNRPNYSPLTDFIVEKLVSRANGMYRLVELLIERLENLTDSTIGTLEKALESVPSTIAETYDGIWNRIPDSERKRAHSIMRWLLCMQHPLSSAGLAIALATECSGYARAVNINALTVSIDLEGDVKRLLGPLIRLQPKIGLSHQSVKDHFLRTLNELEPASPYAIDKSRSHARVALICLRYLNSPDHRFNGGTAEKKNDFLKYALKFAPVHIALGCKNEDMFAEQIELFFRQQVWTKSWEQVLKPELDTGSPPWMPDCTSAISLACRLNLPKLLSRQFTAMSTEKRSDYARRHSVELRCIWLYEALASRNERCLMPILCNVQITVFPPQILQSLFDSALDPLPDLVYNWPKSTTSDFPVVYGARKKRFIRCALQMADIQERLDTGFVVKDQRFSELREYSNIEDRILRAYRTLNVSTEALTSGPMHSPTQTSSMMQLALLLCIFLKSPRLFSLYQKYEHVLALTPAFRANFIEEPLFSAESIAVLQMAQQGNFSVVKALVQEGAGLVARDPNNASVLHWAARSGNPDFVEYVLAIDPTDINSKDARGMTPLHYACTQNHLWDNQLFADSRPEAVSRSKVVKRLLAAGALRQARDTQGNTPLQVLSRVYIPDWSEVPRDSDLLWRGDDLRECLEMLIEGVSDIMQWDSYKTTIMHYAAYFWPVAAVQYLVDNLEALSLPVTLVDHKGFSPMHYAVIRPFDDSVQVIELLARAGVDVRAGGRQGMDAFAIAKRYGKLQALEKLIAVKEAQAFARTKAFQSLLFDTWTELERRKQRGPDAMIQTFLNQHSMSHIPIGPTPLLGFLRFPQAIQPYLNHPSTEFCHRMMQLTISFLHEQMAPPNQPRQIQTLPSSKDIAWRFEQVTGAIVMRFSDLERHLDPFPGIRAVLIHRPLLSTQANPRFSDSTTADDLIALNRPERTLSRKGSVNTIDGLPVADRLEQETMLQERLDDLDSRVKSDDQNLENAVTDMLMGQGGPRGWDSQYRPLNMDELYRETKNRVHGFKIYLYAIVFQWLLIFDTIVFPSVLLYTRTFPLGGMNEARFLKFGCSSSSMFHVRDDEIHGFMFHQWMRDRMQALRDNELWYS